MTKDELAQLWDSQAEEFCSEDQRHAMFYCVSDSVTSSFNLIGKPAILAGALCALILQYPVFAAICKVALEEAARSQSKMN